MIDDLPLEPKPDENALVTLGPDGDPLPDPRATRMIEVESYERIIEGLKISADACVDLIKHDPRKAGIWLGVIGLLDRMRFAAAQLAGDGSLQKETPVTFGGQAGGWRKARERFLYGIGQTTGGMRQLATCFRGDLQWSVMAQQLECYEASFRALLVDRVPQRASALILPPGFEMRH